MSTDTPPIASTTLTAGCKVNLYLRLLGRRPDGYHELESLFLPLSEPCDDLLATPGEAGSGLSLTCDVSELATPANILHKTWSAFAAATGFAPDLRLHLVKRIPFGAGLGGGSSDAAALLSFLNSAAGSRALSSERLHRLATDLGADVPFFLDNRAAWAEGVGEKLTFARPDLAGLTLLLLCPPVRVATAWAYKAWDEEELPRLDAQKRAFSLTRRPGRHRGSFCPEAILLWNSFERVVFKAHPELGRLKERLLERGAAAAVMSGSGSALCALFRDIEQANQAASFFKGSGISAYIHRY